MRDRNPGCLADRAYGAGFLYVERFVRLNQINSVLVDVVRVEDFRKLLAHLLHLIFARADDCKFVRVAATCVEKWGNVIRYSVALAASSGRNDELHGGWIA